MSVGTAKPTSGAMSTATTFSYAQAAKGQSVSQAAPSQSNPSQATPASTKSSQDATTATTSSSIASSITTPANSNGNESVGPASVTSTQPGQANVDVESKPTNEEPVATPNPPSEPSVLPTQEAEKPQVETVQQSEEKRDRSTNSSSRTQDPNDAKKKKGKKNRAAEKDTEQDHDEDAKESVPPPPQPELTEAPIPAVNIWQQRREAQAAKVKTAPSVVASSRPLAPTAAVSNADQKPRSVPSDSTHSNAVHSKPAFTANKPHKKGLEHARNSSDQSFRRSAPRGSRANEKEGRTASDALSSVANTASWPTPETAAVETKPQSQTDKSDKDDKDDAASSKTRKWVPVPFVPSVSFNTPLPTRGGPRGGGRVGSTGRGGREGVSRSHQNAGLTGTHERVQGNGTDSRATSVAPQASKRIPTDTSSRDSRKTAASIGSPKSSGNSSNNAKPESLKHSRSDTTEVATTQQTVAHSSNADRYSEGGSKPSGATKDTNTHPSQESTYPIQNGLNSRHSERTRGNGRGRGGHPNSGSMSHQPHSPFAMGAHGYGVPANGTSRQASQSFSSSYAPLPYGAPFQPQPLSSHRGRPGSMSSRSQSNGGRHGNGRLPPVQPVNVSYDAAMYPQQPSPFNYFENNILTLVQTQIEYYFSIDNLCKDMFLRRHMDSQGFVFLKFITQFRRMQDLTHDHNLVRVASENSREVELVTGEDGLDRLRRREGWDTWVQPIDQRDPSAQNDGPKALHRQNRLQMSAIYPTMMHGGYPTDAPAVYSPSGPNAHFAPYINGEHMVSPMPIGLNGHAAVESHLSAAVPEFSPAVHRGNPGSERTASSGEQGPNGTKMAYNSAKKHEVSSPGDSGVHLQTNGSVHENGEFWREPQAGQVPVNGVNGGHDDGPF